MCNFLNDARKAYQTTTSAEAFTAAYEALFEKYDIASIMDKQFFTEGTLESEQRYNSRQAAQLERKVEAIRHAGVDDVTIARIANPKAPLIDNQNLAKFFDLYQRLEPQAKKQLIQEVLMGVVLQCGQMLAFEYQPMPELDEVPRTGGPK